MMKGYQQPTDRIINISDGRIVGDKKEQCKANNVGRVWIRRLIWIKKNQKRKK